jgi:hypothetical protein
MRLPKTAHTSQAWRIHELASDFRLEDVWALPTPGGPDDFPRLVEQMAAFDPAKTAPGVVRLLFAIRWKIGGLLGWDEQGAVAEVPTVRDRLPEDLRVHSAPTSSGLRFTTIYVTADEWAAEIANRTMHGILHVGWVREASGAYRGQMAILVNPNGLLGTAYMQAIKPFRHLIVYPLMLRQIERTWKAKVAV